MPWLIAVVLFAIWIIGVASSSMAGGLIHLFFAAALVIVVLQFPLKRARGRPPRVP